MAFSFNGGLDFGSTRLSNNSRQKFLDSLDTERTRFVKNNRVSNLMGAESGKPLFKFLTLETEDKGFSVETSPSQVRASQII